MRSYNVIYDAVGGDYAEPALRSIAWEGKYLVVGFAAGDIPRIPLNLALLKGCDIVGVFWGAWTRLNPAKNRANEHAETHAIPSLLTGRLVLGPHAHPSANSADRHTEQRVPAPAAADPHSEDVVPRYGLLPHWATRSITHLHGN